MTGMIRLAMVIALCVFTMQLSCVSNPSSQSATDFSGMIEIRARLVSLPLAKVADVASTVADKLILEISSADLEPIRIEQRIDFSRPSINETIRGVPIGNNRRIRMWAEDANGKRTHIDSLESRTVNIRAGEATPVFATFIPAAGSIYLQLLNVPANTRVRATFSESDGTIIAEEEVPRTTPTYIHLDNIPHETQGTLLIYIIDESDDELLYISTNNLIFNARTNNTIELNFIEANGMVEVDAVFYAPGSTSGSYNFATGESNIVENGYLLITEIMYHASTNNYIELYNLTSQTQTYDTLIIEIDATVMRFMDVTFAPNSYRVFGTTTISGTLPHIDYVRVPSTGTSPINTNGHSITVKRKDGMVFDQVIFDGFNSVLGWPIMSGSPTTRRSVELLRNRYDVTANNFGSNWRASTATTPIQGSFSYTQLGTPGSAPEF